MEDLFLSFQQAFESQQQNEMPLKAYLELCAKDPMAYATAAERLLAAIGEPPMLNSRGPRPPTNRL